MIFLRHIRKPIAGLLILALSIFSAGLAPAQAAMVGTAQIIKQNQQNLVRERLYGFLDREQVREQLEAWGVDSEEAKLRVDSLTDEEVAEIVSRLDQLPAGGDGIGTIVGAAVLIFLVLLLTDILGFTDVFTFVRHR